MLWLADDPESALASKSLSLTASDSEGLGGAWHEVECGGVVE